MVRLPEEDSGSQLGRLRKPGACYGTEHAKDTEHAKGAVLGWFYVQLLSLYTFSFCYSPYSHIKRGIQGPPVGTRPRGVLA